MSEKYWKPTSSVKRKAQFKLRDGAARRLRARALGKHVNNAAKLFVWLLAAAHWSGPKPGLVETTFEDTARANGWTWRKTTQRAIEQLEAKPYIEVKRAANHHELTRIKILKYDLEEPNSAGAKPTPAERLVGTVLGTKPTPPVSQATPLAHRINGTCKPLRKSRS